MTHLWMDCGWRGGVLGTCYYGYREEMDALKTLLRSRAVTIVTGPRGSGKSEFLRYFLANQAVGNYVLVDPTEVGGRGGIGRAASIMSIRKRLMDAVEAAVGIFRAVRLAGEALLDVARHAKGEVVIAVDSVPGGIMGDIEDFVALASMLTNNPRFAGKVKAVVVADSSNVTLELAEVLSHLSVGWLTLGGLDDSSMAALLSEYLMGGGTCKLGVNEFVERIGGLPAYVTSGACYDSVKWFMERKQYLESALINIAAKIGIDVSDVVNVAANIFREAGIDPIKEPLTYTVAEELVKAGVAYRIMPGGYRFEPSLRYYKELMKDIAQIYLRD